MKTAIDLLAALVRRAHRLVKRLGKTRDEICADAVAEYVARRNPDAVTDALDRLAKELDTRLDAPTSTAARRALWRSEWW